jgi:hypothetical protein
MSTTALGVINRALTEIAARQPISGSFPTFDGSAAGVAAGQLYQPAVETLLRQQDWEFARAVEPLVTVAGTPPLNWAYQYTYPQECLRVRQIVPATFDPNDPQPVTWDVGDLVVRGIIGSTIALFNGAGYAIGDTGTILGTTGTPATYQILTVSGGGGVLTYFITSPGDGYLPVPLVATATGGSQPGVGTGFVIDIITITFSSQRVIWTNEVSATIVLTTNLVTEAQWDSIFAEAVVRYLGSMLAMPIGGRPDFSREMLGQAGGLGEAGRDRDS